MRHLQLGGHKGPLRGWALVDDEDYEDVSRWRWSLIDGYATRMDGETGRLIRLHRYLLGLVSADGLEADHINRNRLDNRRENLRIATHAQNCQNMPDRGGASRFRGVRRARTRWQAYVHADGEFRHLGVFDTEEAAAAVAREARRDVLPYSTDTAL